MAADNSLHASNALDAMTATQTCGEDAAASSSTIPGLSSSSLPSDMNNFKEGLFGQEVGQERFVSERGSSEFVEEPKGNDQSSLPDSEAKHSAVFSMQPPGEKHPYLTDDEIFATFPSKRQYERDLRGKQKRKVAKNAKRANLE